MGLVHENYSLLSSKDKFILGKVGGEEAYANAYTGLVKICPYSELKERIKTGGLSPVLIASVHPGENCSSGIFEANNGGGNFEIGNYVSFINDGQGIAKDLTERYNMQFTQAVSDLYDKFSGEGFLDNGIQRSDSGSRQYQTLFNDDLMKDLEGIGINAEVSRVNNPDHPDYGKQMMEFTLPNHCEPEMESSMSGMDMC